MRATAERRSLAGMVGLALLATAGTLTMVSAGAGVLAGRPGALDLALGTPPAAWGSAPILLPGAPAPAAHIAHPEARIVRRLGSGTPVALTPSSPTPPAAGGTPVGSPGRTPTPPVTTPVVPTGSGSDGGGSLPGTPAVHVPSPEGSDGTDTEHRVKHAKPAKSGKGKPVKSGKGKPHGKGEQEHQRVAPGSSGHHHHDGGREHL